MIPVGMKIFKLIVNEFSNEFEKDELAEDNDDEDDDEGDEGEVRSSRLFSAIKSTRLLLTCDYI